MPIYAFKCDCGHKEEDFFWPTEEVEDRQCPDCGGALYRDYMAEKPIILGDIEPYFDFSIGEYITGRRDKAAKYRAGGYTPMYGIHGGDIATPPKQFYEDERHHLEHERYRESDEDKKMEEMIQKGLEEPMPEVGDNEYMVDVGGQSIKARSDSIQRNSLSSAL